MATGYTVRVEGLAALLRATDAAGKDTKKYVREELRNAAVPVRDEAARRFAPIDARTASRYGISVRRSGTVTVEQRLRRTTGRRPDYGALQMRRALLPALDNNREQVVDRLEIALDRMARKWEVAR